MGATGQRVKLGRRLQAIHKVAAGTEVPQQAANNGEMWVTAGFVVRQIERCAKSRGLEPAHFLDIVEASLRDMWTKIA
jgi:hypothetical protein